MYLQYGMFYVKYLILTNLLVVTTQLNLHYTNLVNKIAKENELIQHNCLRAIVYKNHSYPMREIISYCMNEFSSNFNIKTFDFNGKLTFVDLAKENISSEQLYLWSAPIDLIEDYQFYLNHRSTEQNSILAKGIFYNCTWPRFGLQCQYELDISSPDHLSIHDIIHHFYKTFEYNPMDLTCYQDFECHYRLLSGCLDWSEICDGKIDCLNDGIDEKHCWQLEFNQCKDDEYRCINGQCIPQSFHREDITHFNCLDASDNGFLIFKTRSECHTDQPSFRCEDLICKDRPLTSSCIQGRRNLLWETIFSIDINSTFEQCWLATTCLLKLAKSAEICEDLCVETNACIDIVARFCPDILYIPNSPILFGHFYLAFVKSIEQNSTNGNIWMLYICYTMPYYDQFFQLILKIISNNRRCFFYRTISRSETGKTYANVLYETLLIELNDIFQRYHPAYISNSTMCNQWNVYQCINSSKCISIHRLLDRRYDCPYIDDENMTAINNSHAIGQLEKTHFKCQTPNKYISRSLVYNLFCDCNPVQIYDCDDELLRTDNHLLNISFQRICDGFIELSPIRIDGQKYTDETDCQQWQCDNIYTHCDGIWNCLNGADEINCNLSSSSKCPKDHHLCISSHTNQFLCLSIEKINDGNVDCRGGSDEIRLCRQEYMYTQSSSFYCINQTSEFCQSSTSICDGTVDCTYANDEQFCPENGTLPLDKGICHIDVSSLQSDVDKFLCHQLHTYNRISKIYFTLDGIDKSMTSQTKNTENSFLSIVSEKIQVSTNQHQSECQRGIRLHVWLNNHIKNLTCLCPPSYYGSRCQYQSQRISLTIRFRVSSDSYQKLFAIVVSLIDEGDDRLIHSSEQITYLSSTHCKTKFNIYLLYSNRSKDPTKQYHIHVDFYDKISLVYQGSVFLPVPFLFLPVQRLVYLVDIPRITDTKPKSVPYRCVHGKLVQYSNTADIPTFCQCDSGWSGRYCTIEHRCNCGSDSVCVGISGNNQSICVCPIHKFGRRCLLTNRICENNTICQNGGQCIPNDEYLIGKQNFICLCQKGFIGDRCETNETKINLSFDKNLVLPQSIFIHFIEVMNADFPVRSTTFRSIPFAQDSLTIYWSRPFHLVFIELGKNNYYLTVKQTIYDRLQTINRVIHPSDRCPHIRELFNETFVQWHLIRQIKSYHLPCQNRSLNLSCFYDNVHLCLCYDFQQQRLANCFNFEHNLTFDCFGESVCENDGQCLQDRPQCPTRSICMCPACFYGFQCQLSTTGFGLSLDTILEYHVIPNVHLTDQPLIVKMAFASTIILLVAGFLDSILCIMTFQNKLTLEVGCGLYILNSSITTLLITILFGLKFFIFLLSQMTIINNRLFLSIQCYSIDFLLQIVLYLNQWLHACVATERAFTVIKGASFNKKKSKSTAKFVIILLVIFIIGTSIHDPIYRHLTDEESNDDEKNLKRIWCITKYGPSLRVYNSTINTIHFCGPFLVNLISTIILIQRKSRQQAVIQKKRLFKEILIEQLQQNKHLLTAPIVLIILTLPRLIIGFTAKCLKQSGDTWLFLVAYFISFIPPTLTFLIFILPSKFYKKQFRKTIKQIRTGIERRFRPQF